MLGRAIWLFVGTNVDSFVILLAFFGRAGGNVVAALRVVAGEILGFIAILVVCMLGALGLQLVARPLIPYLGLVPLALGLWEGRKLLPRRGDNADTDNPHDNGVGTLQVAAAALADGGDNISAYIPLFAAAGFSAMIGYSLLFLAGVVVMCAIAWTICDWPPVTRVMSRVGSLLLPVVLVAIGLIILVEGHAFGL